MRLLPWEYPLRNIARRPGRAVLTAGCSALAAALIVATVSFVRGLETSSKRSAPTNTAILLSQSSERDLVRSAISPAVADLLAADVDGIVQVNGVPCVSSEIHMGTNVQVGSTSGQGFLRGMTGRAFLVHDGVTLIEGESPGPGEVIVGRLAADRIGLDRGAIKVGSSVVFEDESWRVAGIFAAPGSTLESEIWVPLYELMGKTSREDISAVFVKVENPEIFDYIELFASRRLDLELLMIPAATYYAEMAAYFGPIKKIAWLMAIMVGLAALFGGANIMNAAVQDRMRELATLRAVGYPGLALIFALLIESSLYAGMGAVFGLVLARFAFNGGSVSLAMQAFELNVSALAILIGFVGTWLLAMIGTLPSCWRAVRCQISLGLKEK